MSKFATPLAILFLLAAYTGMAWLDNLEIDKPITRQEQLSKAVSLQLETEAQERADDSVCGNAGWKISKNRKNLICIPRHGKPYTAQ